MRITDIEIHKCTYDNMVVEFFIAYAKQFRNNEQSNFKSQQSILFWRSNVTYERQTEATLKSILINFSIHNFIVEEKR